MMTSGDLISDIESEHSEYDGEGNQVIRPKKTKVVPIGSLESQGRKTYQAKSQMAVNATQTEAVAFLSIDFQSELARQIGTTDSHQPTINSGVPKKDPKLPKQSPATPSLTDNINLDKLRSKYKTQEVVLQKRDYELFDEENQDNLFAKTAIAKANNEDEFAEDFEKEKFEAMEEVLPKTTKRVKGWGDWAGFGVTEKPVDVDKERRELETKIVR